jgi:hypothetical protein
MLVSRWPAELSCVIPPPAELSVGRMRAPCRLWVLRCIDDLPVAPAVPLSREPVAPVVGAAVAEAPVESEAPGVAAPGVAAPVLPAAGALAVSLTEPVVVPVFRSRLHAVAIARVSIPASATRNSRWGSR